MSLKEAPEVSRQIQQLLAGAGRYRLPPTETQDEYPDGHGLDWVRLVIPLEIRQKPIGAWLFGRRDPDDYYPQNDIALLSTLAGQVAVAVKHARLFEAEQARRREAETLREATAALVSDLDLNQVLDGILTWLEHVVPYDSACAFLLRENLSKGSGEWLYPVAGRGFPLLEQVIDRGYPADDCLYQEIQRIGRPLCLPDAQADPRFQGWGGSDCVRGWMGVPLIVRGKVLGCLTLDSRRVAAYGEHEAALVQALANQAATAIENARLYGEIEQRLKELELVLDAVTAASSTLELDRILHILTEKMIASVKATFCRIALLDETNQTLTIRAASTIRDLDWDPGLGRQYALADAPRHRQVIERGQALVLRQDDPSHTISAMECRMALTENVQSALLIPLAMGERILGIVSPGEIRGWERTPITPDQVRICQAVAEQVAVTIENARLYEALRESEEWFRQLAENIHEVFWVVSPEGRLIYISPACEEIVGRPRYSLYKQPRSFLNAIHPEDRERVILTSKKQFRGELDELFRIVRPDGSVCWVRGRAFPIQNELGEVYRIVGLLEDVTMRKETELAVAEERSRIARHIHDGIIQELSSLGLSIDYCIKEAERDPATVHQELAKIRDLLRHNIRELRHIILALPPVDLEKQGLIPALEHYICEWSKRTGIQTHVSIVGQPVELSPGVQTDLWRVMQESLNNVRKHAAAHQVWVTLDMSPATVVSLTVRDDGQGFDIAVTWVRSGGLGLISQMRERAEASGGSLEIHSAPGEGTEWMAYRLPGWFGRPTPRPM